MSLDLRPMENAISRLEEGLTAHSADPDVTIVRDGLVQRFEFTWEITHKMLRRFLAESGPSEDEIAQMSFPDVIRTANERGLLLGNWLSWKRFREMRGKTSHTYDEAVALEVVASIPAFLEEARHLRDEMRKRLA